MLRTVFLLCVAFSCAAVAIAQSSRTESTTQYEMRTGMEAERPSDPDATNKTTKSASVTPAPEKMTEETFQGLAFRSIGPALMSGRIADIVIHPEDDATWFVAVGSGGVWKTDNAGTTWTPIFDDQSSYSIGALALDPNDPGVLYVGTGENVGGRHVGYGDGLYRTRDSGKSWEHLGLKESEHIGKILIDPRNSNVIYVAAQGPLWSAGGQRGLFKSTDGGKSWQNILSKGPYTGVNDVVMDPRNPDVLYATTHQRYRNVAALINGGPETGIWKSTDGGENWRELTQGLPQQDMGRIGLAISPQNPDVIYATVELAWREGGFYRSTDGGETWEKRNDYISGGTGPHYYQELFASPHAFDRVYQMDVRIHWTEDGGKTMPQLTEEFKHSDNHAMAFTDDPDYLLVGTDGGIYETWDHGKNWKFVANLPITQFYKVAVDYDEPFYNIYGGTQDNNTQGGPSQTNSRQGIRNSDWFITLFGDGHQPAVDYSNPDIVYSEWQQGNLVRYDRKTGEIVYIQPQPGPDEPAERFNWDAPILISPHDPATLYYASQRVWRSKDRGDTWEAISPDLTHDHNRLEMPMMGRTWSVDAIWDLWAMSMYSTITSLAESPVEEGLLYAGTDDGLLQVSEDGGRNWREISQIGNAPKGSFINDVKADRFDADTVYVALDNHKEGDFAPYLFKSTDRGQSWISLDSDLPERHLVWRLVQDHKEPKLLFAGTEFGIFFSIDGGQDWIELEGGVPTISFRDLAIQEREDDLVGASFGRSFYVLDDYSPLRSVSAELLGREAHLFEVPDTWWYIQKADLGFSEKASQGGAFFTAPNPPFGAVFTYYLKDELKTKKQKRQESEQELAKEGQNVSFPGWDEVLEQEREEPPAILLTVKDSRGNVVRQIEGPAKAGFHRVAWDLQYPPTDAILTLEAPEQSYLPAMGAMAAPGEYEVEMARRVDGEITRLAGPVRFTVKPMLEPTIEGAPPSEATAFKLAVAELNRQLSATRAVFDRTAEGLKLMKAAIARSAAAGSELADQARGIEKELQALRTKLYGNERQDQLGEPMPHTVARRLSVARLGTQFSTYGPTPTHRESLEIATEEFSIVRDALEDLIESELEELAEDMQDAGVPWTPGQPLPASAP